MESEILSKLAKKGMKLGSTFDGFVFKHPVFEENKFCMAEKISYFQFSSTLSCT